MPYSERFDDALAFAAELHRDHVRKGKDVPYITHLLGVASLVGANGGDEDQVIAALLHDAIEDCIQDVPDIREQIRERYGARVLEIVEGCTDADMHPKPPWRERKQRYIDHLQAEPDDSPVLLVSLADKLYNARSIVRDLREVGGELWLRFKGGHAGTLWYYDMLAHIFVLKRPGHLAYELRKAVDAMVAEGGMPELLAGPDNAENRLLVDRLGDALGDGFMVLDCLDFLVVESIGRRDFIAEVLTHDLGVRVYLAVVPNAHLPAAAYETAGGNAFETQARARLADVLPRWREQGFAPAGEPRLTRGESGEVELSLTLVAPTDSFEDCVARIGWVDDQRLRLAARPPIPWVREAEEPPTVGEAFTGHVDDAFNNPATSGHESHGWQAVEPDQVPEDLARAAEAAMLPLVHTWPREGSFWNDGTPGHIRDARRHAFTIWDGGVDIAGGTRWEFQVPFVHGPNRQAAEPGLMLIQIDTGDMPGLRDTRVLWPFADDTASWERLWESRWRAKRDE